MRSDTVGNNVKKEECNKAYLRYKDKTKSRRWAKDYEDGDDDKGRILLIPENEWQPCSNDTHDHLNTQTRTEWIQVQDKGKKNKKANVEKERRCESTGPFARRKEWIEYLPRCTRSSQYISSRWGQGWRHASFPRPRKYRKPVTFNGYRKYILKNTKSHSLVLASSSELYYSLRKRVNEDMWWKKSETLSPSSITFSLFSLSLTVNLTMRRPL